MLRVYFDQDAIIKLGRAVRAEKPYPLEIEIISRLRAGKFKLVVSPAHLMDTAGGDSEKNSVDLARFMDSLRPVWLLERTRLHRLELRCFLQGIPFEEVRERVICKSLSEVVANLVDIHDGGAELVDIGSLVVKLRGAASQFHRNYGIMERVSTGVLNTSEPAGSPAGRKSKPESGTSATWKLYRSDQPASSDWSRLQQMLFAPSPAKRRQ